MTGDLRQRVTIQESTETSDGHDGYTVTWADTGYQRVAAAVVPLAGRDLERARQVDPRASHQVTLRWWRDYLLALDWGRARLTWHDVAVGDRTLEIIEVPREVEARVSLVFAAKEAA